MATPIPDQDANVRSLRDQLTLALSSLRAINDATTPEDLLTAVARTFSDAFGDNCTIRVLSPDRKDLVLAASWDRDPVKRDQVLDQLRDVPTALAEQPIASMVLTTGEPFHIPWVDRATFKSQVKSAFSQMIEAYQPTSFLMLPLRAGGESLGVVYLVRRGDEPRPFSEDDRLVAHDVALQSGMALSRLRLASAMATELEERRRAEQALARSEARLNEAQAVAHMGSWEAALPAGPMTWSPELYRIFGVDAATFTPTHDNMLAMVHEDDRARLMNGIDLGSSTGGFVGEYRVVRADGTTLHTQMQGRVDCDATGQPCAIVGIVRDETERTLLRQKVLLVSRLEPISTFVTGVAHEINNPLAAIVTNAELGVCEVEDLAAAGIKAPGLGVLKDLLSETVTSARRVARIVMHLRALASGHQGRPEHIRLDRMVASTIEILRHRFADRAHLRLRLSETPSLMAEPARLGQMIVALVENAADAVEPGRSGANEVVVMTGVETPTEDTTKPTHVYFEVRDTGRGIDESTLGRIFDPFFTTKAVGSGTGLGLSMSAAIIKELGGDIAVDSVPGKGSTFHVRLPLASSAVAAAMHAG